MGAQSCEQVDNFEQKPRVPETSHIADRMLGMADLAIKLSQIERVPRYDTESREDDSRHSIMVALQALAVASETRPDLNPYEVATMALVHELVETITRDFPTFKISEIALKEKRLKEDAAMESLCQSLPPFIATLVRRYQAQDDPCSRFVNVVDKIAPVTVDIIGPGSKIMHEDYDTPNLESLRSTHHQLRERYQKRYPDAELRQLHSAMEELMDHFERVFIPKDQYYEGPEYII